MQNLKTKLDPLGLYIKRHNGAAVGQNSGYVYTPVNITEPIYENVPLPWPAQTENNSNESSSRASSIQSAPEIKTGVLSSRIEEGNKSVVNIESSPIQNESNFLSESTTESSSSKPNSVNHSVTTSIVSLRADSVNSGTLGKDKNNKGRKKWSGILGGKSKNVNRHDDSSPDRIIKGLHDTLPKHPLPICIPKEQMCQLLERKLEDSQLIFEFEKIPRIKPNADFTTALLAENVNHNWHKDILPYEENRVRLSPTKGNRLGYVNASNITASVGNQQKFYVAAQSPMATTIGYFWQMIWESDVYLVVNLADPNDNKIVDYFHTTVTDKPFETGEFQIWSQFSQETGHCVTTKLRVLHSPTKKVRGVWHLQYNEWVTDGCPKDVAHFLGFIEEMSSVRQHTISEIPVGHNRNPPILVHCCTGIGRTAVTILSDLLLYTLDHNQELDVARAVLLMRYQRMLMIETVTQYRFVYSLLAYYLKNSRLI